MEGEGNLWSGHFRGPSVHTQKAISLTGMPECRDRRESGDRRDNFDAGPFDFNDSSQSSNQVGTAIRDLVSPPYTLLTSNLIICLRIATGSFSRPIRRQYPGLDNFPGERVVLVDRNTTHRHEVSSFKLQGAFQHFLTTSMSHNSFQNSGKKLETKLRDTSVAPVNPPWRPAEPKEHGIDLIS